MYARAAANDATCGERAKPAILPRARGGAPLRRATVDLGKARTGLGVPLLKDDAVLGIFVIYRQEVRPFSDKRSGRRAAVQRHGLADEAE